MTKTLVSSPPVEGFAYKGLNRKSGGKKAKGLKAKARILQALGTAAPKRRVLAVDRQLRKVLGDIDPFWVRWSAFIDGEGGGRVGASWREKQE